MTQAFAFTQSIMNGTVMMKTTIAIFATRELAEQTMADIKADNASRDLGHLRVSYTDIEQVNIYEAKDEIPFYNNKG